MTENINFGSLTPLEIAGYRRIYGNELRKAQESYNGFFNQILHLDSSMQSQSDDKVFIASRMVRLLEKMDEYNGYLAQLNTNGGTA